MIQLLAVGSSAALAILILWSAYKAFLSGRRQKCQQDDEPSTGRVREKDPYYNIEPLPDFDWAKTVPILNPTFKAKYHLTMGMYTLGPRLAIDCHV